MWEEAGRLSGISQNHPALTQIPQRLLTGAVFVVLFRFQASFWPDFHHK